MSISIMTKTGTLLVPTNWSGGGGKSARNSKTGKLD